MSNSGSIERLSPAKLNLFLHVTGRRADGYHTLQTVFQLLDWGDTVRVESSPEPGIQLLTPLPGVNDEDNLAVRAAELLAQGERGARIAIRKQIPMGGGLGGGSSNAATVLCALNELWSLGHSNDDLIAMGLALGADVPVFIRGQNAWAEGVGELLSPIQLPRRWYLVALPECSVSTAEIFSSDELTRNTPAITMSAFFAGAARNDLQPVVANRYPKVRKALNLLSKFGVATMTGSGSSCFVAFDSESEAVAAAAELDNQLTTVVARGYTDDDSV